MQKQGLRGDVVFVIEDFLTPEECQEFIATGEGLGFEEAPITTRSGPSMRKDVRNNTRVVYDNVSLAERLFERARPFLVGSWNHREVCGMNERFRFYRYEPGQRFAPHFDGRFERDNGERSEFSFLMYLNEEFEGGETRFFEPDPIVVAPRTGSALVFFHPQLHEGALMRQGLKYVLRTDVMYRTPA